MRIIIRYFFRTLRLILTPFMLISEKLSTPKGITRTPDAQAKVDSACEDLALYQFTACPFCIKVRKEIARLGLNIETRDAQHDSERRSELEAGGGQSVGPRGQGRAAGGLYAQLCAVGRCGMGRSLS